MDVVKQSHGGGLIAEIVCYSGLEPTSKNRAPRTLVVQSREGRMRLDIGLLLVAVRNMRSEELWLYAGCLRKQGPSEAKSAVSSFSPEVA